MKNSKIIFYGVVLMTATALFSCTQNSDSKEGSQVATEHHNGGMESHDHMDEAKAHNGHEEALMHPGETRTWKPQGIGKESLQKDFHFISGSMENINPEIIQNEDGDNLLQLTTDGTPAAFVFHTPFGNIGMDVALNTVAFKGTLKLIHHAQNTKNYEFVAITGKNMKLGRIVNGTESVFDEATVQEGGNWISLRVSAAGGHFKGYMDGKTITHGHGDKMKDGFAGVMLEGTGIVLIKSIEIAVLEDE